jgi:hypothetical protein
VLAVVLAAGGRLDVSDWRAVGVLFVYQVRGLAGFVGGQFPSMVADGDRCCLTEDGRRRAAE